MEESWTRERCGAEVATAGEPERGSTLLLGLRQEATSHGMPHQEQEGHHSAAVQGLPGGDRHSLGGRGQRRGRS